MIFIITGVAALISILIYFIRHKYYNDESDTDYVFRIILFFSTLVVVAGVISSSVFSTSAIKGRFIDQKIEMYQSENNNIENKLKETVDAYIDYESDLLNWYKPNKTTVVSVIAAYPKLSSQELVKTQIDIYNKNNTKIKELKEDKIKSEYFKWLLYFGGQKND